MIESSISAADWPKVMRYGEFVGWQDLTSLLLCGGDKSTQEKDIKAAKRLADDRSE
jgi:putative component of toxin-antitoxin plasmid stabilization module